MSKPGVGPTSGISLGGCPDTDRAASHGAKLDRAPVWNVRTWPAMLREMAQAAPTVRPKVPTRRRGADCLVVVKKDLQWSRSERGGSPPLSWVNRQRDEPAPDQSLTTRQHARLVSLWISGIGLDRLRCLRSRGVIR